MNDLYTMSIDAAQEFARRGIARLSRVWEVDTKRFEMLGDFRSTLESLSLIRDRKSIPINLVDDLCAAGME